jgi:hypothetical protein
MTDPESWLPELIEFSSYGNWEDYLEAIHDQFLSDFVSSSPTWPGKRMSYKRHPEYREKSATFWHFTSEGSIEDERPPDFRRCERIAWPRAIIDRFAGQKPQADDPIVWWENLRGREVRVVLALPDFSYVVIMADRGGYIMPWTAYPVERPHQRHKLEREYLDYWK